MSILSLICLRFAARKKNSESSPRVGWPVIAGRLLISMVAMCLLAAAPLAFAAPDLTITKSHTGNFTQSQNSANYNITVTNSGDAGVASGATVTVTDTMPASGLTATSINGSGWSCTQPSGPCQRFGGNTVLAAGASYPLLTLIVDVAPNAPASVTNTVAVSGGGEVNTANDTASDPTTIGAGPDFKITKSHVGNFTQSQNSANFTITVTNIGTGAAQSGNTVTVTDTFPAALTATSINGSGWSCTQPSGPCQRFGGNVVLAAGASYPDITLIVDVPPNAPASVTNNVAVSGGGELNTANNTASDTVTIGAGPDFKITKSHVGNFTQSQNSANFTITVTNIGTGAAQSGNTVTVTDTFPAALTATSINGSGWSCTQPSGPCQRFGGNVVLAAGASYPDITLIVDVPPNAPASVTNNVAVSGGGELNTANNTASDTVTIGAGPDFKITKSHVGNFTQSQNSANFTITVTNIGTGAAQSGNTVTVTDTFPAALTATSINGSGWSCTQPSGPCQRFGGNVVLAAGASYPDITLIVDVPPNAPASVTNNVAVSGGGELNTANNTASDTVTIGAGPDFKITKSPRRQLYPEPEQRKLHHHRHQHRYRCRTVRQYGDGHRYLPGRGLTATSINGSGWSCTQPSGPCQRFGGNVVLAAGASYPDITLIVDVAAQRARIGHQQRRRIRRRRTQHRQQHGQRYRHHRRGSRFGHRKVPHREFHSRPEWRQLHHHGQQRRRWWRAIQQYGDGERCVSCCPRRYRYQRQRLELHATFRTLPALRRQYGPGRRRELSRYHTDIECARRGSFLGHQ